MKKTAFVTHIVQHLVKWEPSAPKLAKNTLRVDDESFIDSINKKDEGESVVESRHDVESQESNMESGEKGQI